MFYRGSRAVRCISLCLIVLQRIEGSKVYFINDECAEFDHIILCTGYKIDLPFLSEDIRDVILDPDHNDIKVINITHPMKLQKHLYLRNMQI